MRILIRCDASVSIGSGHVMRCLTLADALNRENASVEFVCRTMDGHFIDYIEERGYLVHKLPSASNLMPLDSLPHESWLSVPWQQDATETLNLIDAKIIDWIVVDHYGLGADWEIRLNGKTKSMMVIDDLANRRHQCDLLLDQNYYVNSRDRYRDLVPTRCRLFLGPAYALIRPDFKPSQRRRRNGTVKNILVFFGAVDSQDLTSKVLTSLERLAPSQLGVDVVVGRTNPNNKRLEQRCGLNPLFRFHCQTDEMASLMKEADLFIGSGGTVSWERCIMGLPALTIAVADNQVETSRALGELGACIFMGIQQDVTEDDLIEKLETLLRSPKQLLEMGQKSVEVMRGKDFMGADGLAKIMNQMRTEGIQ